MTLGKMLSGLESHGKHEKLFQLFLKHPFFWGAAVVPVRALSTNMKQKQNREKI